MIDRFVTAIHSIDVYGMVSISLFVLVFAGVLVWAFTRRQDFLNNMSTMPLEEEKPISNSNPSHYE